MRHDPETKWQSMIWKHVDSPTPKKFKVIPSVGKVITTVLWVRVSQGVIITNYLTRGSAVTGTYYANELRELREALKSKRPGKLRRGVLLLSDDAPAHTSSVATSTVAECGYELMPSPPPYSPDLAPSNFYLFALLKEHLRGGQCENDDDVI